jgi:hypothetical protein
MAPERTTQDLEKLFENDYSTPNSHIILDFIVVPDCARKFIESILGPRNGEWLLGKNMWSSNSVADIQTILRDCSCGVGATPTVPVWVANSLGLNPIDSLYLFL